LLFFLANLLLFPSFYTQAVTSTDAVSPVKATEQIPGETKPVLEVGATPISIKQEVKLLREDEQRKMPYLDGGHIKEWINRRSLEKKKAFKEKEKATLSDLIDRALQIHTPAKAAQERVTLAKRRILVAGRELLPSADFAFTLRKGALGGSAFTGSDYHMTFQLPIFRGGILWNSFLRERAEYRAAKKEYDAVVNDLLSDVAEAYFEFNRARETLEDHQQIKRDAEKQRQMSKQKYDQGLISEVEHLNVDSMVGEIYYDVESASQEFELAKLELEQYVDVDQIDEVKIESLYDTTAMIKKAVAARPAAAGEVEKTLIRGQSLDELVDLAYQNRPELQVETARLRATRLEEKIARGAFLPRVDLLMEFGELGESFLQFADDPPHFPEWHLSLEMGGNVLGNKIKATIDDDQNGPSVSQFLQGAGSRTKRRGMEIGILNGLRDYAETKEAQVKKLEQIVELEKKEQEVIRDVKESYFDFNKSQIQVESSLKRNQYRERLAELAAIRLERAEIEISEYLQALVDLTDERERLHEALANYYISKAKLNKAIGVRDYLPVQERYGL
jgi:outer membrane protein TolC